MAGTRTIRFELHIRPMFRRKDRENMLWAFDLWNFDDVRDNAASILNRLQVDMPPEAHGGTWPDEWVAVFKRWIDEGFGRLELGSASYSASLSNNVLIVKAMGSFPTETHRGWLQRLETDSSGTPEFRFFFENQGESEAPGFPFTIEEKIKVTEAISSIVVNDDTGPNTIAVEPNQSSTA